MHFSKVRIFIPVLILFSCEKDNVLSDMGSYGPGVIVENQKIPPGYEANREKFKLAKSENDELLPTFMKGRIAEISYPDKNEDLMFYTEYSFEYKPREMVFIKTYIKSYLMYGVEEYLNNEPSSLLGNGKINSEDTGNNSEGQLKLKLNSVDINPNELKISKDGKLNKVIKLKYPELVMPFFPSENGEIMAVTANEIASQLKMGSTIAGENLPNNLKKFSTNRGVNYVKTEPNSHLISSMASLLSDNSGVISEFYYSTFSGYTLLCEKRDLISPDGVTYNLAREIYYYETVY